VNKRIASLETNLGPSKAGLRDPPLY
jgi:hypothetical protein